jgi:hypothetical protein
MTDINKKDYAPFKKTGSILFPKNSEAVKVGTSTATADATNVGAIRYRVFGTISYAEMVMQTGASTYAWVEILRNDWT